MPTMKIGASVGDPRGRPAKKSRVNSARVRSAEAVF